MNPILKTPTVTRPKKRQVEGNTDNHKATYTTTEPKSKTDKDLAAKIKKVSEKLNEIEIKNNQTTSNGEFHPKFVFEEYQNMRTLIKIPINNVWIEALAREMTQWIDETPDAIRFDEFLRKKAMLQAEFIRLKDKSPVLSRAYEYTLAGLAQNREVAASKFKMNWAVISATQSHYCDISKTQARERAKLKEEMSEGGTKIVVMDSLSDYDEYLKKKDNHHESTTKVIKEEEKNK